MAEPTITRRELRRAIGHAEHLQFFLKYGDVDEVTLATDSTVSILKTNALTQGNDFWNNGWAYVLSTGGLTGTNNERKILDFSSTGDALTLEWQLPAAPVNGNKLEIYDLFSPSNIHAKINEAIARSARQFPETILDGTLVLEKDKLRYSLTGLARSVHRLHRVQIERVNNSELGVVDSVATSAPNITITDTSLFTEDDKYNGWVIVFYDGTSSGSFGTIDDTTSSGTVIVTLADFTVAPVAGDSFRIYDPNYQTIDLMDLNFRYLDTQEYPDTLYIEGNFPQFYGFRLFLHYTSLPQPLVNDSSTTTIPSGLIIARARALLHEDLMLNNRADTERHRNLSTYFHQQADTYAAQSFPQRPPMQQTFQGNLGTVHGESDPLGWGN